MRLTIKFRKALLRKLDEQDNVIEEIKKLANEDSDDDGDEGLDRLMTKIPDEEFQKRLYSSQYNDEFLSLVEQARVKEVEQVIIDDISGK